MRGRALGENAGDAPPLQSRKLTTVVYKMNSFFEKTKMKICFLSARQDRFCGGASPLLFLFAPNDNEKNVRDEKNLLTLGVFSIIIYLYE